MMPPKWLILFHLLLYSSASSLDPGKEAAVSTATLKQINLIEKSIDHEVEPCDSFYDYACGIWEDQTFAAYKNNHIPYEKKFLKAVKKMLVNKYPDMEHIKRENQSFTDKVMAFYYSCVNDRHFDFFEELKPGNGIEWPLVDDLHNRTATNMEHFDLFAFLGQLYGYGFDNFLLSRSVRRESNGSLYLELDLPLGKELNEYDTHDMLVVVGYDYEYNYEKLLKYHKEIHLTHDQWLATYKTFSLANGEVFAFRNIKQLYPQLAKFLASMLPNQLKHNDVVKIKNIKYIEYLIKKQWQPQEYRELCNYAMIAFYKYLFPHFIGECADKVRSKMHFAVNYMYRQHFYTVKVQTAFNDLEQKIYKYLMEMVNENYLEFNVEQLKAVKDKLARTYVSVGNVPDYADDATVEEFYRHIPHMDINNYSQNLLWSLKQRLWESINCPDNMECLEEIEHGTYNIVAKDLVIIALASLRPPMYSWAFDPLLAVSLMGVFIGHEYAHAIDTDSLVNRNLYESMYEQFKNHSKVKASIDCTNEQYSTNYLRQLQADLAGARAAFRAYNTEYKMQPSFTTLPWQKLFFLNYAQYFCQWKDYSGSLREYTARTNYVAMNMDEFAQAFKCPAGSKMNPVKKCLLY